MAEVPVKLEKGGSWVTSKIEIAKDSLILKDPYNLEISFRSIVDLQLRGQVDILIVTSADKSEKTYKIASVEKVLQVLNKKIIMACNAYRLMAHFMSPAIRGGVLVTNAKWEKGAIAVLKTGIWFVSQEKMICVPLKEVASLELTKRELQHKKLDVVKVDHLENSEVVTSFILCPLSTLQVLYNFLRDATKDMDMKGSELDQLDAQTAQVAMLIYSGMDTKSIENMLSLSAKELDVIYDTLLKLKLVDVVMIRKEVQLTPKGVRYITDALKPPA
ncbi:MAG TPA: CheF family chemotaxis protein [Methanospirillum sp.]|uniref:CheF family chemotaxis protein n=1 Tax=Methanospirillum sp. TaxID=45200 RepID=UPI002CB56CCE|nr:CheF family chemotaxis protein [Methanospirillum sp.]HWQ62880.1 CheF family chemotaxis protein [Methanospirillum sp.]